MKKLITLFFILAAFSTTQALNIPLVNGDFSSGVSTLSGSSPWTSIPGFTITQSGTATSVTAASSGVFAGTPNELKLVGTVTVASAVNTDLIIKTTPVDISTLGNTATLTFAYQMKTASVTATNIPYNIILRLTDINGVDVTTNCTNGAISKVTPGFKTGYTAGTYLNASCGVTLQQNSAAATGGLDASFISLEIQCAKILGNTPSVRSFTLTSSAVAATTTVSTPASTALTYVYGAGPSAEQSYTVSGANLTANVVVTPGSNLEISTTSGSGFASAPITLTQSGGTVATTTIYTRLIAGLAVGTGGGTSTRLITVSTATSGVANKTIQFTASITAPPYTTTVSTPSNSALSYETGFGPSAESTFTVSGDGLLTDLTVTPGSSIEISSTSGSGFVGSLDAPITLTQTGGTVPTTTIYARLKAGFGPGGTGASAARTVTIGNVEAGYKTVVFTGTVTGLAISNPGSTALYYAQGTGPSPERTFNVTGASLTADVVVNPGTNVEISTTTGTGFASAPITLTQTGGVLAATPIYARLIAGLVQGSYNDASTLVTASSTGFIDKTVQFVGTVDLGTALTNSNISNLKCFAADGTINVTGVKAGNQIEIFNSVGQKLKSVTASDNNNISLSAKGIYLIKVDTFVQKVILK
ncbi:MAG: T9SS type A sorting domain-containing protein [Paludibacter sp.]